MYRDVCVYRDVCRDVCVTVCMHAHVCVCERVKAWYTLLPQHLIYVAQGTELSCSAEQ